MNLEEKKETCYKEYRKALRQGKLQKPIRCQRCGRPTTKLLGHHKNYAYPLKVDWLCNQCHKDVHAAMYAEARRKGKGGGRPNQISFVSAIYTANPLISDDDVCAIISIVFDRCIPSQSTLQTWKSHIRKKGLKIPDRRRSKNGKM